MLTEQELRLRLALSDTKYSPDQPRDDRGRFGSGDGESGDKLASTAVERTIAEMGPPHPFAAQQLDRIRSMSDTEATHAALTLWRGSFIHSSNMRAISMGNDPAPAMEHDYYMRTMTHVLEGAVRNADHIDSWRSMPSRGLNVGDTYEQGLMAVALERSGAREYSESDVFGHQDLYRVVGAPTVKMTDLDQPSPEGVTAGRFRVEEGNVLRWVGFGAKGTKYSPDQPRDADGRFGSGGTDTEIAPGEGPIVESPHLALDLHDLRASEGRITDAIVSAGGYRDDISVKLTGMDTHLADEVAGRVEAFGREFPRALATVTNMRIAEPGGVGRVGHALKGAYATTTYNVVTRESSIYFNARDYVSADALRERMQRSEAEYPDGHPLFTTQFVIDHELGHVLDNLGGLQPLAGFGYSATDIWGDTDVVRSLGTYAVEDRSEAFAEAFAVRQSGGALDPHVREAVDRVTSATAGKAQALRFIGPTCVGYVDGHMPKKSMKYSEDQPRDERGRFGSGGDTATVDKPTGLPKGWALVPTDVKDPVLDVYRNGDTRVSFYRPGPLVDSADVLPHDVQMQVVQRVDDLMRSDPTNHRLDVDVLPAKDMATPTAGGETFTGVAGGYASMQVKAEGLLPGYEHQPLYETQWETKTSRFPGDTYGLNALTHEYGHALMHARDYDSEGGPYGAQELRHSLDRIHMMNDMSPNGACSEYGNIHLTNDHEAYAEAFADWRLSKDPSPLSTKLAAYEGWGAR